MADPSLHILAGLSTTNEHLEAFLEITKSLVEETRKEEKCLHYSLLKAEGDENNFIFVEKFVGVEGVDAHKNSEHFKHLFPQMLEKCTRNFVKRAIDKRSGPGKVTSNTAEVPQIGDKLVRFVVSVFVTNEEAFLTAAQDITNESLNEVGCIDYTYAKVENSADNEYLYIELWKDDAALEAHRMTSHCARLIPILDSCSTVKAAYKAYEEVYQLN